MLVRHDVTHVVVFLLWFPLHICPVLSGPQTSPRNVAILWDILKPSQTRLTCLAPAAVTNSPMCIFTFFICFYLFDLMIVFFIFLNECSQAVWFSPVSSLLSFFFFYFSPPPLCFSLAFLKYCFFYFVFIFFHTLFFIPTALHSHATLRVPFPARREWSRTCAR